MSDTIEDKCVAKGIKLTDQRKVIARVMSESKETYGDGLVCSFLLKIKCFL